MNRDWLKEHLLDAIDGTLGEADKKRLEREVVRDPDARSRLNELGRIADITRQAPALEEPPDFVAEVMARVREIEQPWWRRLSFFLIRPRQIRVNLLGALSGAAALAVAVAALVNVLVHQKPVQVAIPVTAQKEYVVKFSYYNPDAKQVYVAGSFNNWQKDRLPMADPSGRGAWVCVVSLKPGTYEYMFLVDGQWVPDGHAQRYKDDGFGRKNGVLNVGDNYDITI